MTQNGSASCLPSFAAVVCPASYSTYSGARPVSKSLDPTKRAAILTVGHDWRQLKRAKAPEGVHDVPYLRKEHCASRMEALYGESGRRFVHDVSLVTFVFRRP